MGFFLGFPRLNFLFYFDDFYWVFLFMIDCVEKRKQMYLWMITILYGSTTLFHRNKGFCILSHLVHFQNLVEDFLWFVFYSFQIVIYAILSFFYIFFFNFVVFYLIILNYYYYKRGK